MYMKYFIITFLIYTRMYTNTRNARSFAELCALACVTRLHLHINNVVA